MPLTRFEIRNEFRLGDPELYRAAKKDDSKAILDGVAVAGLIGILRQLGDLAEFASEIFHDLHEQITATAARSHKMMARVQQVEAVLPPLEKAVFSQTSHLHFAYAPGSEWHADIHTEHSHLGNSDLPSFIMNSYEESRDPPRLFLLDKFDSAGAGACLKRYSDPAFFKTFWANSELASAEKSKKERKAYKNKKKAYQGNGNIQNAASVSQHYSRIQLASPDTVGCGVAAQTISTSGIRSKFALEIRSMNQTSKLQPFSAADVSSTEHEELQNSNLTPKQMTSFDETNPTVLPSDQDRGVVDIDSPHDLFQGPCDPRSSSITWDEKMEIVKPTREVCGSISKDQTQALGTLPGKYEPRMVQEAANLSTMHQEDILFDVHNVPESYSGRDQSDEFVSETDNYADALNTIESEAETDAECQTKWEVELQNNLKHQEEFGTSEIHNVAAQSSNSSKVEPLNPFQLVSSENLVHAPPPEMASMASIASTSLHGNCNPLDASSSNVLGSLNGNPGASSIPSSQGMNITVIPSKSQECQGTSSSPSVNIWTNGGLLGLQPSKPPDFSMSSVTNQSPLPGAERASTSVKSNGPRQHNSSLGEEHDLVDITSAAPGSDLPCVSNIQVQSSDSAQKNNFKCSSISMADCMPPVKGSLGKESCSHNTSPEQSIAVGADLIKSLGRTNAEENMQQNGVSWTSHEVTLKEQSQLGSSEILTSPEPPIAVSADLIKSVGGTNVEENTQQNGVSRTSHEVTLKEQSQLGSSEILTSSKSSNFNCPSPPLEHMKISFHPMNGMETSKLQLEFPNGNHFHKIIEDPQCPSFQLLPKLAVPMQEIASESDDDTFYKSSPYPSDDILSPRSESNSEQWESAEMTGSKDQDVYDTLCRVPSSSSFASSSEVEGMTHHSTHVAHGENSNSENGMQSIDAGASSYTPHWSVNNYSTSLEEAKGDPDSKNILDPVLQYPEELPPLPPLPPLQWRVMKPKFASEEYKEGNVPDANNLLKGLPVQGFSALASSISKPTLPKLPHSEVTKHDQQRPNNHREITKAANSKEPDEREDFLHQIRNKSFSLRPTVSTRPSLAPVPTTNINVAAILEKANAIRQAYVGSHDGGDDENWSDG